jgi:hypothetical protein
MCHMQNHVQILRKKTIFLFLPRLLRDLLEKILGHMFVMIILNSKNYISLYLR